MGAGLGSVWVCSKAGMATADMGCAINCADFTMRYQPGVKPYWLHIAYHGRLDHTTWQDRVLGAMRLVLKTILGGEDAGVHCMHGPRRKKDMFGDVDASTHLNMRFRIYPRSQVHKASTSLDIPVFSQANIGQVSSSSSCWCSCPRSKVHFVNGSRLLRRCISHSIPFLNLEIIMRTT